MPDNIADMVKEGLSEIEIYYDLNGIKEGKFGCFRARVAGNHGIHSAGVTEEAAIDDLMLTLKSFNMPCTRADYKLVKI